MKLSLNSKGALDLGFALILVALLGIAITAVLSIRSYRLDVSRQKQDTDIQKIRLNSAIETFLNAYRFAEIQYIRNVSACASAYPFYRALRDGSHCDLTFTLFDSGTTASGTDPGVADSVYKYTGNGCEITKDKADCNTDDMITIGVGNEAVAIQQRFDLDNESYRFRFIKAWPELKYTEFALIQENGDTAISKEVHFAVRSFFSNLVHFETDGRVTQETPEPMSKCPNSNWGSYSAFKNNACIIFNLLGGSTGLASYKGNFFAFDRTSGKIYDLLEAASPSATTYLVDYSTGKLDANKVFVKYPNPSNGTLSLTNIDDITTIDEHLYFVSGSGLNAQIGFANSSGVRTKLCDLSAQGWSQSYAGIAALSWSDSLVSDSSNPADSYLTDRYATFYLKTDSGDFLTSTIFAAEAIDPNSTDATVNTQCWTSKDDVLQQSEYKRTLGFDRSLDEKPYYIF